MSKKCMIIMIFTYIFLNGGVYLMASGVGESYSGSLHNLSDFRTRLNSVQNDSSLNPQQRLYFAASLHDLSDFKARFNEAQNAQWLNRRYH